MRAVNKLYAVKLELTAFQIGLLSGVLYARRGEFPDFVDSAVKQLEPAVCEIHRAAYGGSQK
jgi:hypothetical protein